MKKINAAVIGTGFGHYVIIKALKRFNKINIVSLCGKKLNKTKKIAKLEKIPTYYIDWKKMINNEKIDLLLIATLPSIQFKILNFIKNKKKIKFLFIEKPVADNLKNIKKIMNILSRKRNLIVDFLFLEIDLFKKFEKIFKSKKNRFDKIYLNWSFNAYHFKNKISTWKTDLLKGGSYQFYLVHNMHYFIKFFGNINNIYSIIKNRQKTKLSFKGILEDGKKFHINFNCNYKGKNLHYLEASSKNNYLKLYNKSKNHVNGFNLKYKIDNKFAFLRQKKMLLKKNENDYRINLIYSLVKKLIYSKKIDAYNLKTAVKSSNEIERILKNEI